MTPASVFLRSLAAAVLFLPAAGVRAQTPGSRDTSFNAGVTGATVYALDYQTDVDGTVKITAGGERAYGQYFVFRPDGTTPADFLLAPFGNPARIIYTIVQERAPAAPNLIPNLLIGGQFDGGFGRSTNGGRLVQNLIRITPSGAIDTDFSTGIGTGANNFVTSLLPLDDGRIVVGGLFTAFNRQPRRRIVRLLNNGTPDTSFATGLNIDNDVLALAEGIDPDTGGPDGSTLVGGLFNRVAGQSYAKLVRLDPNGNLDMSFHPQIDLRVLAILVQADGKIVIGGDFTTINGRRVARLARLNYDGSLDTTFVGGVSGVPNKDVNPTAVYVLKAMVDGRIYVGGEFAQINGAPRQYLGLISADGVVDNTFVPTPANVIYDAVQTIAIQPDNKLLIGETLGPRINDKFQPSLIRLIGVAPVIPTTGTPILGPTPSTPAPVNE